MKKIPLHIKILIALILGACFGAFFNISEHVLVIKYLKNQNEEKTEIVKWQEINFIDSNDKSEKEDTYEEELTDEKEELKLDDE